MLLCGPDDFRISGTEDDAIAFFNPKLIDAVEYSLGLTRFYSIVCWVVMKLNGEAAGGAIQGEVEEGQTIADASGERLYEEVAIDIPSSRFTDGTDEGLVVGVYYCCVLFRRKLVVGIFDSVDTREGQSSIVIAEPGSRLSPQVSENFVVLFLMGIVTRHLRLMEVEDHLQVQAKTIVDDPLDMIKPCRGERTTS